MGPQSGRLEAVEDDGWQIVTRAANKWRIPFGSVSWSYSMIPKLRSAKHRQYTGSLFLPLTLSDASSSPSEEQLDVTLNPDLCGVLGATEAVRIYEVNVGFHHSALPDLHLDKCSRDISVGVDDDDVLRGKEQWGALVQKLGALQLEGSGSYEDFGSGNESGESSPSSSLHRSTSTLSSIDSDLSTDSISFPSTPKAKNFDTVVHIKGDSPSSSAFSVHSSPARPLNATASSFVPSFIKPKIESISFPPLSSYPSPSSSPSPPPTFANFTFPTLEIPSLPAVKIKKDEQGFYSEVKSPAQSQKLSVDLLPPFLQERRKAPASRTRAMVERLRSFNQDIAVIPRMESKSASHCSSPSPPFYDLTFPQEQSSRAEALKDHIDGSSTPALDEDEDGWIDFSGAKSASPESKAQRTRDLFLALTRRRSDSLPAKKTPPSEDMGGLTQETTNTALSTPSPSPAIPNDGWLEPSAVLQEPQAPPDVKPTVPRARTDSRPRSRTSRKRRSSNHNSSGRPLTTPHHFVLPANLIARPPGGVGMPHPAISISFPVQPPPAPFFQSPYSQMMVPMQPYAPYMFQMQMQAQTQMLGHRATAGGDWFSYPQGVQPLMTPHASIAVNMNMTNAQRPSSLW